MAESNRVAPRRPRAARAEPPIPLEPVDLLAGLAPGVQLEADDAPPGLDREAPEGGPAWMTVAEAGKLVRAGEGTIRRLIRTPELRPLAPGDTPDDEDGGEVERAGVLPATRQKPGE
jgi:hypothetical protein